MPTLQSAVEDSLGSFDGRIGIFIKNLKTGESYRKNQEIEFEPGSLYKLWLMESVLGGLKWGKLSEDDKIREDIAELNRRFNIASEEAELKTGQLNLTAKSALEQMITISHNYAALALLKKMGNEGIPKKVTAEVMGLFFEKLYKGDIVDWNSSQKMIDILGRQKINDRIPKYLPPGTKVAHKTADLGFFEHDGGIVFTPKADFIIVVLTESDSPVEADEKIAQISQAVYEYFMKKN